MEVKVLKLGNRVLYGIPAYYVDDNGTQIWNIPTDINELKQTFLDTLLWLQNKRVRDVLSQYDYLDMGDLLDTANNPSDPDNAEATAILNWYRAYYTEIDSQVSVIQGKQKIDTLLQLDLKAMEEQAFQNAVSSNPLP